MPSIQKIKNKNGTSYRVIIRKKGLKPITKTFKLRQHASEFIDSVYSNNNLLNHLGSSNKPPSTNLFPRSSYLTHLFSSQQTILFSG